MDHQPNAAAGAREPQSESKPPLRHQDDVDEDDDAIKQLQECSALYLSLQDCLVKTDRNWKSCQFEVQALKACHDRRKNSSKRS